ncbi:MAG TPA: hypothetical protein VK213_09075 [Bacteroidales bacterium]|nr:hypothetical protein [Bacteroidales bacterium]
MPVYKIPEPLQFNTLKHHLIYMRYFIAEAVSGIIPANEILKSLKHTGTSVMDVYAGKLNVEEIASETINILKAGGILDHDNFLTWTGNESSGYRILTLSDYSRWAVKYHKSNVHYVHIFPARGSPFTFRVKANTIKSAILYLILSGRDYITTEGLNAARSFAGLSPVKDIAEVEAIVGMIEILRNEKI